MTADIERVAQAMLASIADSGGDRGGAWDVTPDMHLSLRGYSVNLRKLARVAIETMHEPAE